MLLASESREPSIAGAPSCAVVCPPLPPPPSDGPLLPHPFGQPQPHAVKKACRCSYCLYVVPGPLTRSRRPSTPTIRTAEGRFSFVFDGTSPFLRWQPLSGPKIPAAVVSILASHRVHLDHAHMRHWFHFPAPGVLLVRFPPRGNAVGRNEQCTDGIVPGRTCQRAPSSFRVGSTHTLLLPQPNLLRWLSS